MSEHVRSKEQVMTQQAFQFEIGQAVPLNEAELTLHLSMYAAGGLFGEARVRLDTAYSIDWERRIVTVGAGSEVGRTLVKIFTGLLLREFGEDAFSVQSLKAANADRVALPA
jgi:hypothetical protein